MNYKTIAEDKNNRTARIVKRALDYYLLTKNDFTDSLAMGCDPLS